MREAGVGVKGESGPILTYYGFLTITIYRGSDGEDDTDDSSGKRRNRRRRGSNSKPEEGEGGYYDEEEEGKEEQDKGDRRVLRHSVLVAGSPSSSSSSSSTYSLNHRHAALSVWSSSTSAFHPPSPLGHAGFLLPDLSPSLPCTTVSTHLSLSLTLAGVQTGSVSFDLRVARRPLVAAEAATFLGVAKEQEKEQEES